MKIRLHKIESGVCPYCGSMSITYDSIRLEHDMLYYPATCDSCGGRFDEWFHLVFSGHNVGDNCEIETYDGEEDTEIEMKQELDLGEENENEN